MANKNSEQRSQYINRVHFFDKTLFVDGISADKTPGYFPPPATPTYSNAAEGEICISPDTATLIALKKTADATAYLLEAGINTNREAGLTAYRADSKNWIKAGIRKQGNVWFWTECIEGNCAEQCFELPHDFRFGVYHTIRIERNGTRYTVFIDEMPAPGKYVFQAAGNSPCTPGLFAGKGENRFDGLVYTRGWDESDEGIEGWNTSHNAADSTTRFRAFKGDLLPQYDFSLQISNHTGQGQAGAYPVYIDEQNFVKAILDYESCKLRVEVREKGQTVQEKIYSLENRTTLYADMKYTDFIEKGYSFTSPARINAILLGRGMSDKLAVEYLRENQWRPINGTATIDSIHPGLSRLDFQPVCAEALRFTNKQADDLQRYIYRIQVNQLFRASYHLRAVKTAHALRLCIDGKEIDHIPVNFGPAQVGVFSQRDMSSFNGIMRYEIP